MDHLLITSNQELTYSSGFGSIIPVATDPESQPQDAEIHRAVHVVELSIIEKSRI